MAEMEETTTPLGAEIEELRSNLEEWAEMTDEDKFETWNESLKEVSRLRTQVERAGTARRLARADREQAWADRDEAEAESAALRAELERAKSKLNELGNAESIDELRAEKAIEVELKLKAQAALSEAQEHTAGQQREFEPVRRRI